MRDDCHPAWGALSASGWVAGGSVDVDYTSRVDDRHSQSAQLFVGIPPVEYDCAYFVFVDSISSRSRTAAKIHLLEAVNKIRHRENWPKRINGELYAEKMIDFALAECMHPAIRKIPGWWECIAEVTQREWDKHYSHRYERIYDLLNAWAWSADARVWINERKVVKGG